MPRKNTSARVERVCAQCGDVFATWPAEIRKGGGKFCSPRCHYASRGSAEARFWRYVDKTGDCWLWLPTPTARYGLFKNAGESIRAHRFSWELHFGPIPEGLMVCHTCDTPRCVRPDHLFLGTAFDNQQDCARKGRKNPPRGENQPLHRNPQLAARGSRHGNAKLTEEQVATIRQRVESGELQYRIAAELGISKGLVSLIVRRTIWQHVA